MPGKENSWWSSSSSSEAADDTAFNRNDDARVRADEEYDKIVANVNELGRNVASIAGSLMNISSHKLGDLQEEVEKVIRKTIDESEKEMKRASIDDYFPRPYQNRDPATLENERKSHADDPFLRDADFGFGWGNGPSFFWGKCNKSPYGYTCKYPTRRAYRDCNKKDGLTVWDSKGHWRCLFPNSEVAPEFLRNKAGDKILTKEDFFDAVGKLSSASGAAAKEAAAPKSGVFDLGNKGMFFSSFTDYLDWQNSLYAEGRRTRRHGCHRWGRRDERDSTRAASEASTPSVTEAVHDFTRAPQPVVPAAAPAAAAAPTAAPAQKQKQQQQVARYTDADPFAVSPKSDPTVVSYSVQSSYSSNPETNEITLTEERKEFYSDGTANTKRFVKTKPFEAKDWTTVDEYLAPSQASSATEEGNKNGWFWKN